VTLMYQHQLWSCYQNVQIFLFNILKTVDIVQNASAVASSDRTDLSTECGSGPIQLARDRYRAARRSVADSPPHCMNAPQRTAHTAGHRPKSDEKSVRNENIQ